MRVERHETERRVDQLLAVVLNSVVKVADSVDSDAQ